MRVLILLAILVAIIIYVIYTQHPVQSLEISPSAAKRHRFSLILDVRTPRERETLGFYPNSIPLPIDSLQEVPSLIGTGPAAKQKEILVYANGDSRAHVAAKMLYAAGFTRVRYIATSYDAMMPPH